MLLSCFSSSTHQGHFLPHGGLVYTSILLTSLLHLVVQGLYSANIVVFGGRTCVSAAEAPSHWGSREICSLSFAARDVLLLGLWGASPAMEHGADAGLGPRSVEDAACSDARHISRAASGYWLHEGTGTWVAICRWPCKGAFPAFSSVILIPKNPQPALKWSNNP